MNKEDNKILILSVELLKIALELKWNDLGNTQIDIYISEIKNL